MQVHGIRVRSHWRRGLAKLDQLLNSNVLARIHSILADLRLLVEAQEQGKVLSVAVDAGVSLATNC